MTTLATPAAILAQLSEMDTQANVIDAEIRSGTLNPPLLGQQWITFLEGYRSFSTSTKKKLQTGLLFVVVSPVLYASQLPDLAASCDSYQAQLNSWASIADKQLGGNAGQTVVHAPIGEQTLGTVTSGLTTLAWVAGIGAGLYVFGPTLLGMMKKRRR